MRKAEEFLTAVFTAEGDVDDEARKIVLLLESGVDTVHIRKPGLDEAATAGLIESVPVALRHRLRLHDHFALAAGYGLAGVHLNSRNPEPPAGAASVTASCHTPAEVRGASGYEYVTLSPVFDSISKRGYRRAFDIDALGPLLARTRVVALGGVTPDSLELLRQKGFFGAALLGYIWSGDFGKASARLAGAIAAMRR